MITNSLRKFIFRLYRDLRWRGYYSKFKKDYQNLTKDDLADHFQARVLHFQGLKSGRYLIPEQLELWKKLETTLTAPRPMAQSELVKLSKMLTIISCTNLDSDGSLLRSLTALNWPQQAFLVFLSRSGHWENVMKIDLLLEGINQIRTPYILFCDTHDVLIRDLRGLLEEFEKTGASLLLNAERVICYPFSPYRRWQKKLLNKASYQFLNSGVWIAQTSFFKEMLKELAAMRPHPIVSTCDQILYQEIYRKHFPQIQIDGEAKLFQTMQFAELSP